MSTEPGAGHFVTASVQRAAVIKGILAACEPGEAQRFALADQILCESFSLPSRHDAAAIIANEIRLKLPDVDGLIYRSVKRDSSRNLALRPQSVVAKCNIVAAFVADACVIDGVGKGVLGKIDCAAGISDSGHFLWSGIIQTNTQTSRFSQPCLVSKFETEPYDIYYVPI